MQLRFDGKIGFPGGLLESNEEVHTGLNRELKEEIDLDLDRFVYSYEYACLTMFL